MRAVAAVSALAGAAFIYHNDDVRFGWRADDVYVEPLRNGWTLGPGGRIPEERPGWAWRYWPYA